MWGITSVLVDTVLLTISLSINLYHWVLRFCLLILFKFPFVFCLLILTNFKFDNMMFWEWDLLVLSRLDIRVDSVQSSVCHCCSISSFVWVIASVLVDILLSWVYRFHGLIYLSITIGFFVCYLLILFIFPFDFCLLSLINKLY